MRQGLSLLFAKRFWRQWAAVATVPVSMIMIKIYYLDEDAKECYAMRGQSNLFREDAEKLQRNGSSRELWT